MLIKFGVWLLSFHTVLAGPSLMERMGERCYTANKEEGLCTIIKECPVLYHLMKKARTDKSTSDYLIRSVCGYDNNMPIVCCPIGLRNSQEVNKLMTVLPDPPVCGISNINDFTRIVGGDTSKSGSWPWMAAIGYKLRNGYSRKIYYRCGGVIITDKFVLSAAHCDDKRYMKMSTIRIGVLNISATEKDNPAPVDLTIEKIISYEFNEQKYLGDILLIKVSQIKFTSNIKPICLPKSKDLLADSFIGDTIYVAGWGTTGFKKPTSTTLQEVKLPVLSNSQCQNSYKSVMKFTITHMCAGYMTGGKDACQGDSGGPMMIPLNGVVYAIGVISVGYKCAEPDNPGVYTRISSYVDWIVSTISNNK